MTIEHILDKLIFRPVVLSRNYKFKFDAPFEEFFIFPENDVSLNFLKFSSKNSKGALLYFHGNKDNLNRWGKIASELTKYNYDVYVIDYRGYGKSKGILSEKSLYNDSLFFYNYIKDTFKPNKIVLYGRSLGTGMASWLASKVKPSKLILETPYYSMYNLVGNFLPEFFFKNKLKYHFNTYLHLKNTEFKIIIFHGTKDEVVPYESGQKLFKCINNINKIFYTIEDGKHNNLSKYELYWEKMNEELK
ncbi:MAG: alpha/beta hydrolase [Bacteroidia bacterium]|nr:alpha/beta hydrolase [Bacteroidia bacterium]